MTAYVTEMTDEQLRVEMQGWLRGKARQCWKWVRHGDKRVLNPIFTSDGTATADGVSERVVLEALVMANRNLHARRSESARQAAATRAKRQERRVYESAARIADGHMFGPASYCAICGKQVTDTKSIDRGIGSDCWQLVLDAIEQRKLCSA